MFFSFWIPLFFFLPPSETIRSGVTNDPETDWKGEHKANPKNRETETNVTLLFHRAGILLCMYIIIILQLFFTTFTLSVFFHFSSLCLVLLILFLCLIALLD